MPARLLTLAQLHAERKRLEEIIAEASTARNRLKLIDRMIAIYSDEPKLVVRKQPSRRAPARKRAPAQKRARKRT
jgi:hypothetical protein